MPVSPKNFLLRLPLSSHKPGIRAENVGQDSVSIFNSLYINDLQRHLLSRNGTLRNAFFILMNPVNSAPMSGYPINRFTSVQSGQVNKTPKPGVF
jgi:hypothetical protein